MPWGSRIPKYACTICKREVGKSNLKSKRVQFKDMSPGGTIARSRVIAWLCVIKQPDGSPSCLEKDVDWNRPLYATAPGMADTSIAVEV